MKNVKFLDLNIPREFLGSGSGGAERLFEELSEKGFEGVALVYNATAGTASGAGSSRHSHLPCPKSHSEVVNGVLKRQVEIVNSATSAFNPNQDGFQVYSRLHIVMDSNANAPSKGNQALNSYNLISVEPKNEKMFALACQDLEFVDIITIDMSEKIPFYFKAANINMAISRGIVFELTYSVALRDATARKYFISNAYSLVKATKGKNIILSSSAKTLLELRGVFDIMNMCSLFDLSPNSARDSMTKECHKAILHAAARRETVRGIVTVERIPPDLEEREKWKVRRIDNGKKFD